MKNCGNGRSEANDPDRPALRGSSVRGVNIKGVALVRFVTPVGAEICQRLSADRCWSVTGERQSRIVGSSSDAANAGADWRFTIADARTSAPRANA